MHSEVPLEKEKKKGGGEEIERMNESKKNYSYTAGSYLGVTNMFRFINSKGCLKRERLRKK